MKSWRVWVTLASIVLLLSIIATATAVWKNVSSEWHVNQSNAQYALDHTPINRILSHDIFTASGNEDVFYGTDTFQHKWYAFVSNQPLSVRAVSASGVLSKAQMLKIATKSGIRVKTLHIGDLDNQTANTFHTTSSIVWEVYGSIGKNDAYVYYDGKSGKLLWKYVL